MKITTESQATPAQQKMTPHHISADKHFDKLSADGSRGLYDLSLARLAIYDGRIGDAKNFSKRRMQLSTRTSSASGVRTKVVRD
jgi:hypothetical protein